MAKDSSHERPTGSGPSDHVEGEVPVAPSRGRPGVWHIGPRDLPLPHAASDELRESIAASPQPDPTSEPGVPADETALRALVAAMDAMATEKMQALRDRVGATVTPETIDGVGVFHVTPATLDPRHDDHVFVYVHGGAYVLNAGEAGAAEGLPPLPGESLFGGWCRREPSGDALFARPQR